MPQAVKGLYGEKDAGIEHYAGQVSYSAVNFAPYFA